MRKICIVCGREYETNFPQSKCCSDMCRDEHKRRYALDYVNKHKPEAHEKKHYTLEPRLCVVCGKEYTPKAGNQKYCSDKCSYEHRKPKTLEYERERYRRKQLEAAAEKADYVEKNSQRTHLDDVAADAKAAGTTYGQYVHRQTHPDGVTTTVRREDNPADHAVKLRQYVEQLQLLLTGVASGRKTVGALNDAGRLKDCIVSEALQLCANGALDKLERLLSEEKESRP